MPRSWSGSTRRTSDMTSTPPETTWRCRRLIVLLQRTPGRTTATSSMRMHRSEEHTSELQSLMRISYAVFCLKKKNTPELRSLTVFRKSTVHFDAKKLKARRSARYHWGTERHDTSSN